MIKGPLRRRRSDPWCETLSVEIPIPTIRSKVYLSSDDSSGEFIKKDAISERRNSERQLWGGVSSLTDRIKNFISGELSVPPVKKRRTVLSLSCLKLETNRPGLIRQPVSWDPERVGKRKSEHFAYFHDQDGRSVQRHVSPYQPTFTGRIAFEKS